MDQLRHICEVCEVEAILSPDEAYQDGWDYPPRMGVFGMVSPRTCPNCQVNKTLWWAVVVENCTDDMLSDKQRQVLARILAEPDSLAVLAPRPTVAGGDLSQILERMRDEERY